MPTKAYLESDGSQYIGSIFTAILYGIYLGAYFLSTSALLKNSNFTRFRRMCYISYGSVLLLLNTLYFFCTPLMGQRIWITCRKAVSEVACEVEAESANSIIVGNVAQSLAMAMSDALLIYRCYIVFGSRSYIIMLPTLCAIATFAIGIAAVVIDHEMNLSLEEKINAVLAILSTATNVMITALISYKILSVSRQVQKLTASRMTRSYMGVVTWFIESAAVCSALGIFTSVTQLLYGGGSAYWSLAVPSVWTSSIALAPQLIILRMSWGSAWTRTTSEELTHTAHPVVFAHPSNTTTFSMQSLGDSKHGRESNIIGSVVMNEEKTV